MGMIYLLLSALLVAGCAIPHTHYVRRVVNEDVTCLQDAAGAVVPPPGYVMDDLMSQECTYAYAPRCVTCWAHTKAIKVPYLETE